MVPRYVIAAVAAAIVTFGLFFVMQALVHLSGRGLDDEKRGRVIEFVRLKRESDLALKDRRIPEKKPPPEAPPPPPLDMSRVMKPDQTMDGAVVASFDASLDLTGPNLGAAPSDSDIIPLVRVNPQYPMRAAQRGIEGWVEVEFTITPTGTVQDPVVIAAQPKGMFDRAALRAIRKWKYNPKMVEGTAVVRSGVKVRLTFELED